MKQCNPKGPLIVHICKLFPKADTTAFDAYGRILSGTVKPGDQVRVLGEAYSPDDEEDSTLARVTNVWVFQALYRTPITKASAGKPPPPPPFPSSSTSKFFQYLPNYWQPVPSSLFCPSPIHPHNARNLDAVN